MKPFEASFWKNLETELYPYPLTPTFRRGLSGTLKFAMWDYDAHVASRGASTADRVDAYVAALTAAQEAAATLAGAQDTR